MPLNGGGCQMMEMEAVCVSISSLALRARLLWFPSLLCVLFMGPAPCVWRRRNSSQEEKEGGEGRRLQAENMAARSGQGRRKPCSVTGGGRIPEKVSPLLPFSLHFSGGGYIWGLCWKVGRKVHARPWWAWPPFEQPSQVSRKNRLPLSHNNQQRIY